MGKFILGDCMDLETGLPSYPDGHFDLAIVDPPYGIDVQSHRINSDRETPKWKSPKKYDYKTFDDTAPPDENYFKEVLRVSKNQIIWGGNFFSLPVSKGWIVWDKKVNEKEHLGMAELAWTSFDRRILVGRYLWAGFKKAEQVIRIHPTQKPVALYRWLLENYAKPGQLILDTHVGSASSLIACESMGFNYVGFEIDPDYYAAAQNRMSKGIQAVLI